MPIYEYACANCDNKFELLVRADTVPECPQCHSRELGKLLSVPAPPAQSQAAPAMPSACGSCPNAGGPGACAFG